MFVKGLRSIQRFLSRVVKEVIGYGHKVNYLVEFLLVSFKTESLALDIKHEDEDVIIEDVEADDAAGNCQDVEVEEESGDENKEDDDEGWFGPGDEEKKYTDNFSNSDSDSESEEVIQDDD